MLLTRHAPAREYEGCQLGLHGARMVFLCKIMLVQRM